MKILRKQTVKAIESTYYLSTGQGNARDREVFESSNSLGP